MKKLLALWLLLPWLVHAQPLTVSAAASLTESFKRIGERFEVRHPGVQLRFNFAASGVLLQQIANGAPVDVFASADPETMDRAAVHLLPGTRRDFAANALVMITPANESWVNQLGDLAQPQVRRIALGKPASVPAGRYAQQLLQGAQLWEPLQAKLVFGDNVRQVLDYVARAEVAAGFVYRTDAALMPDKVRVAMRVDGRALVRYPVAVVKDSRQPALARQFVDFLGGPEARALLRQAGFEPLP